MNCIDGDVLQRRYDDGPGSLGRYGPNRSPFFSLNNEPYQHRDQHRRFGRPHNPHIAQSEITTATIAKTQGYVSSSEDTDGSSLPKAVIVDKVMSFFVKWLDRRLGGPAPPASSVAIARSCTSTAPAFAASAELAEADIIISQLAERRVYHNSNGQRNYLAHRKALKKRLEYLERRARGSHGAPSGSVALPGGSDNSLARSGESSKAQKQKRASDSEQSGEESGGAGDGQRGGKRPRLQARDGSSEKAKLACPYYKHNPRKYKQLRPCCGPGWDFAHRIKEHLYRKHALPRYSCPRCCERFKAEDELTTHARAPEPCAVREPELHDGFTQAQERRLRSRKKDRGVEDLTEAQKWRQMYQILFPDVRQDEIPSPYYEDSDLNKGELEGFEDYLRRELPPLVRRQLEQEVDRELNFVEEGLKRRVINMVQGLQLTLLQSYRKMEESEASREEAAGPSAAPSADPTAGGDGEPGSSNTLPFSAEAGSVLQIASPAVSEDFEYSAGSFNGLNWWGNVQSPPFMAADGLNFMGPHAPLASSYPVLASDSGYTSGGGDAEKADHSEPEHTMQYAKWSPPWAHNQDGDIY